MDVTIRSAGIIQNGAFVTDEGRIKAQALVLPMQAHVAGSEGEAYQIEGAVTPSGGIDTVLIVRNTSTTRVLQVNFIRLQVLDMVTAGTPLPSANTKMQVGHGTTWASGGAPAVPVNTNTDSNNTAEVEAYSVLPAVSGAFNCLDTWYPQAEGDKERYDKQGSLIIAKGDSIEIRLESDFTDGLAYARVCFAMVLPSHLE